MHQQSRLGLLGFPSQHTVHSMYWNSAIPTKLAKSELRVQHKYASSAGEAAGFNPSSETVTLAQAEAADWSFWAFERFHQFIS